MPVSSLKELVALIRAQPGKINWAGVTGGLSFVWEGFLKTEGLEMAKIPYRNAVEAANDLAQGRVQVYRSALAIVQPQLEAGKIKLLAMSNSVRAPAAPEIPTMAEAGYPVSRTSTAWSACSVRRACRWRCASGSLPTSRR